MIQNYDVLIMKVENFWNKLMSRFTSVFLRGVQNFKGLIDDYAKDGGKEPFTKMHCVL